MSPIDHSPRAAARTEARKGRETYQASAPEPAKTFPVTVWQGPMPEEANA